MVTKNLIILGAGDCGRELVGLIEDINKKKPQYNIIGFLDKEDKIGEVCGKYKVLGQDRELMSLYKTYNVWAVIAMQDGKTRKKIAESLPEFKQWETIIHPSAIVLDSARVGAGAIISPNVVISVDAVIGEHCFFNMGVTIGHDCIIGSYSSFMSGSTVCGRGEIGEMTYIATNATVIPQIHIGSNSLLGAGSVAVENIPDNVMVYGNPGRIVMKRK